MPDKPRNYDDEFEDDGFEDDDSSEFELTMDDSASDLTAPDKTGSDSDVRLVDSDADLTSGASHENKPAAIPNDLPEKSATATPQDFAGILLRRGTINADQLLEARSLQQSTGTKLQDAIVKLGYASVDAVTSAIAEFHGLQFFDLSEITIPQSLLELVPESVAREKIVLPIALTSDGLGVVMSDPSDKQVVQELQFVLQREILPVLAPRERIIEAINRHYGQTETESVDSMLQEFTDEAIEFNEAEAVQSHPVINDSDPVVKLVNLIVLEAISLGATAIHLEPACDRVRTRYRIDGLLVERDSLPRRLLDPVLLCIKLMSNIAVPERPQRREGQIKRLLGPLLSCIKSKPKTRVSADPRPARFQCREGRMKVKVDDRHFQVCVHILPTDHDEAAVMRIVDRRTVQVGIRQLGFQEDDHVRFHQVIKRSNGLFLLTGPPGSGTTTTLYVTLNELNRSDRKIITAEDSIEHFVPGINQVEVKNENGHDYAGVISEILRQGPDIIAIGEIRDRATARMAMQASLAGHLVLSTLRSASDASSVIPRLADMGVEPFLTAGSVSAILAQRLVRVICPRCQEPDEPPPSEISAAGITTDALANATFRRGRGCSHCHHTGYRGRTAIFELLKMSAALREMTLKRAPAREIRRQARLLSMRTLLEDGVNKAARGITSLEEVLSACRHEFQTDATDLNDQ